VLFGLSAMFGARRGAIVRAVESVRLRRRSERQHLLRAIFEARESQRGGGPVAAAEILRRRAWHEADLRRALRRAARDGLARSMPAGILLTGEGESEARRMVRNHRLWELYLVRHAEVAASHVDRDADLIEHVIGRDLANALEAALESGASEVPASVHPTTEEPVA
jgi:manganese/zinc/iron transport system permease protein